MKQYKSPSKTCVLFTSGYFVRISDSTESQSEDEADKPCKPAKSGKDTKESKNSKESKDPKEKPRSQCTVCKRKFSSLTSNSSLY